MKFSTFFIFSFIFLNFKLVLAQEENLKKRISLPKNTYFDPILLDPIECQPYIGFFGYSQIDNNTKKGYVPFSMATQKVLTRWQKDSLNGYEIGFDAAAFTQFEWLIVNDKWQRNILNSDFKGSFFLNVRKDKWALRTRLYHISSHLGDDYIIRNKIRSYTPNPVNYEQLDITLSHVTPKLRIYSAMGLVVRPETIRKRFSSQFGFIFNQFISSDKYYEFIFGSDVKILAQNNYQPNVKIASGIRIAKIFNNPVCFLLEFYQGHLPFSVYEIKKVKWAGISFYFNPL